MAAAVMSAAELGLAEDMKVALGEVDPAVWQHVVDRSRQAGNEAFRNRQYAGKH